MKWYTDRINEIGKNQPIYSCCGDDCAVCPRFLANTDEELQQTAQFWYEVKAVECRAHCDNEAEWNMLKRAFYEKERNLYL